MMLRAEAAAFGGLNLSAVRFASLEVATPAEPLDPVSRSPLQSLFSMLKRVTFGLLQYKRKARPRPSRRGLVYTIPPEFSVQKAPQIVEISTLKPKRRQHLGARVPEGLVGDAPDAAVHRGRRRRRVRRQLLCARRPLLRATTQPVIYASTQSHASAAAQLRGRNFQRARSERCCGTIRTILWDAPS